MTNAEDEIGWREELVLECFKGKEILHFYELPPGIGRKTMNNLVRSGLVRIVGESGDYSKPRAWALVH